MIIVALKYTLEQIQIEIYVEGITDKWVEMNSFMLRVLRINGLHFAKFNYDLQQCHLNSTCHV